MCIHVDTWRSCKMVVRLINVQALLAVGLELADRVGLVHKLKLKGDHAGLAVEGDTHHVCNSACGLSCRKQQDASRGCLCKGVVLTHGSCGLDEGVDVELDGGVVGGCSDSQGGFWEETGPAGVVLVDCVDMVEQSCQVLCSGDSS